MSARNFATTFAIALLGGLVATAANAKPYNARFALTVLPSEIDSNDDGMTAGLVLGEVKGSGGSSQLRGTIEFGVPVPVTVCSDGELQFDFVRGGTIQTFKDLSQLFIETTSGYLCFDPVTNASTTVTEGNFTGGTGRFEGASGSVTIETTVGLNVAADISVVNGTTVGTLVLP